MQYCTVWGTHWICYAPCTLDEKRHFRQLDETTLSMTLILFSNHTLTSVFARVMNILTSFRW